MFTLSSIGCYMNTPKSFLYILFLCFLIASDVYGSEPAKKPLYIETMSVRQQVDMLLESFPDLRLKGFSMNTIKREVTLARVRFHRYHPLPAVCQAAKEEITAKLSQEYPHIVFSEQEINNAVANSFAMTGAYASLKVCIADQKSWPRANNFTFVHPR